jgi:TatD DNase family protein
MLIDTHAHLWFPDYYPPEADQPGYYDDLEEVLARAKAAGVEKIIVPGTDRESSQKAVELARKYPGVIYASVGVHPEEILNSSKVRIGRSDLLAARERIVAIGEIGTDASTEELKNCMDEQKTLFKEQCELALELDLPVIIHTRNSLSETLEMLDGLKKMPRGQFHCFSHDEDGVKQVLSRGFYISFCGNIAWSKRVAKLVPQVPDNLLLLETDSPFMDPGKRNEPMNVTITAQMIADLRGQSLQAINEQTTANALRLFKL